MEQFFSFLTASYASLAVLGIAFRQEQVVEFAQILEYFIMYSSCIISYQFETSLDMFVELYQIVSEHLRQFHNVFKNKFQHVLKLNQITSEYYNSFKTFITCLRIVSNHIRVHIPAVFGQVSK